MTARPTRLLAVCAAALAFVLLGGCGIPVDSQPRDLPDVRSVSTVQGETTSIPAQAALAKIFLVNPATGPAKSDRLQVATRQSDLALRSVMKELLKGPAITDARTLQTAIPPDTMLKGATVGNDGTAEIDLDQSFFNAKGDQLIRAVAQVVFTASATSGVTAVRILVNGANRDWPRGDGTRQTRALTVADFAELNPSSQPDFLLLPAS